MVAPTASSLPSWLIHWDQFKHGNHPHDSLGGDQNMMGQLIRLGPSLIAAPYSCLAHRLPPSLNHTTADTEVELTGQLDRQNNSSQSSRCLQRRCL